jgi:hypothetical protein
MTSNEKEISHGVVSWQTRRSFLAMGPLASSAGWMTDYSGTLDDDERSFDQRQRSATKVQAVTTTLTTAFLPTLAKKCRPG